MHKESERPANEVSGERSVTASRQRPKRASNPTESQRDRAASTAHRQATPAAHSSKTLTRAPILRTFLLGRVALLSLFPCT